MRIAVQHPAFLRIEQTRNFDGYNFEFVRQFKPVIYLPTWGSRLTRGFRWRQEIPRSGLDPGEFDFVHTVRELNRRADVLVCFNQGACLSPNKPPARFKGLKIWHAMDFNYRVRECLDAFRQGGVHFLMAYTALDRHCGFFRRYYPEYIDKVIAVPFGFGARFVNRTPFEQRVLKVVAMGAINPVNQDSAGQPPVLREYAEYYRDFPFSQMWRRRLVENQERLDDVLDSFLPQYPEISRPGDDPVDVLNRYALYANDDSICHFPPARTYEGAACGAVMVSPDHECFRELGFDDAVNCIMHRPLDLVDFREKVTHYLTHPAKLKEIAHRGCEMVRSRYTHAAVARDLHRRIVELAARH